MADKIDKKKAYKKGKVGELVACFYLMLKGYRICERRYKTPVGEIDIVAKKGNVVVFCEVKARNNYVKAIESITNKQKQRISRAAEYYMSYLMTGHKQNKLNDIIYRCDVMLILPRRWPVHIENAW